MKRLVARMSVVCLCLAMALCLSSCGEKEKKPVETTAPSQVVAEALDAAQRGDFESVVNVLDPDNGELGELKAMLGPGGTELTVDQQKVFDQFAEMFRDFDYEITGETVKGDQAEVTVDITAYNYQKMLRRLLTKMSGRALSLAVSADSKEQLVETLKAEFIQRLGPALKKIKKEGRNKTNQVTLQLTKNGENWKIDELNDGAVNALTGGLMYEVAGLADLLDLS